MLRDLTLLADSEPVQTVIDVGVFQGTPELYEAFPGSDFILVDPIKNGRGRLKSEPRRYKFVHKALGSSPGSLQLNAMGSKTTLLERTPLTEAKIRHNYDVEVITLDTLIDEHALCGRIGIKIDTEGYEVEVVKGLRKHRERVSFVISEASIKRRFVGGYLFSDLVLVMKEAGFEFFNILNRAKPDPLYYDTLFLRSGHPLFG